MLHELVALKLARFGERLQRRRLRFSHCEELVAHLAARCSQGDSGARLIDHLIDQHLQPLVVDRLLDAMAASAQLHHVHATLDENGTVACEFA
ncbi:type VI secretion ATPase, ClpV1 family [compost metagenome]